MHSDPTLHRVSAGHRAPLLLAAAAVAALAVVVAIATTRRDAGAAAGAAAQPAAAVPTPVRQLELLHAERFRVDQPFRHLWRAERPLVASGWLLVLAGDAAAMVPRQTLEPVLYVGAETAERINTGQGSGRLVVLVPGDFWLEDAPIFYGAPALPEELRQRQIDAELARARAAGAVAPTAERAAQVAAPARSYATDYELRQRAIDLVEQHAPDEKDLIAGWRVPLVR
ncbi:MAG: hypothetical protein KF830_03205 [Planctomycetes bacterium]|nr:hypothetical protein [Planctomycetota bacterium]